MGLVQSGSPAYKKANKTQFGPGFREGPRQVRGPFTALGSQETHPGCHRHSPAPGEEASPSLICPGERGSGWCGRTALALALSTELLSPERLVYAK